MKRRNNLVIIIFIFLIMISLALAENFRGIFIPNFKSSFDISDSGIGFMDSLGTLSYVIFTFIGSLLCEKFGQKIVFIIGLIIMSVSMILYSNTTDAYMLYCNMFVLNMGLALTSIAINTIVPIIAVGFQAVLMNLTHFCYGLGATTAPTIGGILLTNNISWRSIYFYVSILFIVILVLFSFVKLPQAHKSEIKEKRKLEKSDMKIIALITLGLGFYVFAELGTGTWFVNYANEIYGFNTKTSGYYMSLFFLMLTIGRLTGGFIVEKIGYFKSIIIYLISAILLYFSGIIIGSKMLILVSISGFFFSIIYPTTLVCISKIFKTNTAAITGIVITLSSGVRMLLSLGIGSLNEIIGTYNAYYIIPLSLVISLVFMGIVYYNTNQYFINVEEN